jgi:hypothetical protein
MKPGLDPVELRARIAEPGDLDDGAGAQMEARARR